MYQLTQKVIKYNFKGAGSFFLIKTIKQTKTNKHTLQTYKQLCEILISTESSYFLKTIGETQLKHFAFDKCWLKHVTNHG